jgi:hypothetical protein
MHQNDVTDQYSPAIIIHEDRTMSSGTTAIEVLESMPLDQRIAEVAKDVLSRTDRYKEVPADNLAGLLGIVFGPLETFGEWEYVTFVSFESAESLLEEYGAEEMVALLEKVLPPERIEQLKEATEGLDAKSALSLFSADEQRAMERAHQEFIEADGGAPEQIAYCEVPSDHDKLLIFEVLIDDGEVSKDLRTPYDRRDGNVFDLTRCLISHGEPPAYALKGQS